MILSLTVKGFKKGNRAPRASTAPLGMFLGTTSLSVDINLQDIKDQTIFDAQMKKSDRRDSDIALGSQIASLSQSQSEWTKQAASTANASDPLETALSFIGS
jgi:hypothetical protein